MAAAEPGVATDEPHGQLRFRLLERLAPVPSAAGVASRAAQFYGETKARSFLLATRALSTAVNAAMAVIGLCGALVRTSLGPLLQYADRIACQSLEQLQKCYLDVARRLEELAASVVALGRILIAQLPRYIRLTLSAVARVLCFAAGGFAFQLEILSPMLHRARDLAHQLLLSFDHFLDWRIFLYSQHYPPMYNNFSAEITLASRIRIVRGKVWLVLKLFSCHELRELVWKWGIILTSLQPTRHGLRRFRDIDLAVVQHAYLVIAILIKEPFALLFHDHFYADIRRFYHLCVVLPEPDFDISMSPDVSSSEEDPSDNPLADLQ